MKVLMKATSIFTLIPLLFFVSVIQGQSSGSIYTLPKGTQIRVRMDNEINSKVSSANDTFTTTISAPVIIRGIEVLPVGTVIEGRVIRVKNAAFGKSNGSFEVAFETLYLADDLKLLIDASLINTEKPKPSQASGILTIAAATTVGALVGAFLDKTKGTLLGAGAGLGIGASAVLLQKGEEARIRAGEEFTISLNRDVNLPPKDY